MFQQRIRVFSKRKSTTGHLSRVTFLVISIMGKVWLMLFSDKILRDTNLSICLSIRGLSFLEMGKGHTKKGESSIMSMLRVMFGHSPIPSRKLNAFL